MGFLYDKNPMTKEAWNMSIYSFSFLQHPLCFDGEVPSIFVGADVGAGNHAKHIASEIAPTKVGCLQAL